MNRPLTRPTTLLMITAETGELLSSSAGTLEVCFSLTSMTSYFYTNEIHEECVLLHHHLHLYRTLVTREDKKTQQISVDSSLSFTLLCFCENNMITTVCFRCKHSESKTSEICSEQLKLHSQLKLFMNINAT